MLQMPQAAAEKETPQSAPTPVTADSQPPPPPPPATAPSTDTSRLLSPLGFPPYERDVDVRIPFHFSGERGIRRWYEKGNLICETGLEVCHAADRIFRAGKLTADMGLVTANYFDPSTKTLKYSPRFFAVYAPDEEMGFWEVVHHELRGLIRIYFEDQNIFEDPPLRWIRQDTYVPF